MSNQDSGLQRSPMTGDDPFFADYRKRKRWMLLFILLICGALIFTGTLYLTRLYQEGQYSEKLLAADRYYENQNYEAAVLAYKLVIDDWPQKEEPYEKLSRLLELLYEILVPEGEEKPMEEKAEALQEKVTTVDMVFDRQPMVLNVPEGAGTWWNVCVIENGEVRVINEIR